jgi:hypothetical protein
MHIFSRAVSAAGVLLSWATLAQGAGNYPMSAELDARAKAATASVTATVSISVERLMEESRRIRVTDGLKYNGYPGFLKVLRVLPPVGTIRLAGREVEIRYAHEQPHAQGRRVVLVADRPLFFLAGDPAKNRTGYELTIVELIVDGTGGVVGTMAGAARVKPGSDGVPILDDFADIPVRLEGRLRQP